MTKKHKFLNVGRRATRDRLESRYKAVLSTGERVPLKYWIAMTKDAAPSRHERRKWASLERRVMRAAKKAEQAVGE